jgi:DNA polymerase I-like protein with 3'-5' exonuclease and polymerase domains
LTLHLPSAPEWVVVDTETSGLHPDDHARVACVAITWPDPLQPGVHLTRAFPFDQGVRDKFPTTQLDFDFDGLGEDPNLDGYAWRELCEWLTRQQLVFHHAKYDLCMMRVGTRHWPGVDLVEQLHWDTMLAQRVLDPLERASLDLTCRRLGLGAKQNLDALKTWLKKHKHPPHRYDLVPWPIIKDYVVGDTEMTADLFVHQQDRLEGDLAGIERVHRMLDQTKALYRMEERGVAYEDELSLQAAAKLEKMADEVEARMPFHCVKGEAHDYFFRKMRLEADRHSEKTGRPSLDEEQVRKWKHQDVPWAAEYAQVTKYRRAVSMWYRGYPEKIGVDGRLRTVYRQGQALDGKDAWVKSGRMSVERVQLQAIPKKDKNIEGIPGVRELIRAEEGMGLWNLDLSQAELRVASHYAQCVEMLRQLAEGQDIHGNTTKGVIKVDGQTIDEQHPLWKEKRDIAKRLTFGGIFQIGGETFQKTLSKLADIHLPLEECYEMVSGWRRMYPEFGYAYRRADRKAATDGYVRLLPNTDFEIRSYFRETDYTNTGWNRMVQGSLAEAFMMWLAEVEKRWPGFIILTVHDSIVMECRLDEGDQIAAEVAEYGATMMTDLFGTTMKVDVDRW